MYKTYVVSDFGGKKKKLFKEFDDEPTAKAELASLFTELQRKGGIGGLAAGKKVFVEDLAQLKTAMDDENIHGIAADLIMGFGYFALVRRNENEPFIIEGIVVKDGELSESDLRFSKDPMAHAA